jgi:SAM-dependent methyltransferase
VAEGPAGPVSVFGKLPRLIGDTLSSYDAFFQRAKLNLLEVYTVVSRRLGFLEGNWRTSLPAECSFWERALANEGRDWQPGEFRERTDPNLELQEELKSLINAPPGAVIRILDIGAGPLTTLGRKWQGRELQIVPLDPLADEYNAILARLSVKPPVATVRGLGEELVKRFGENSFDMAYSSNALDHTENPVAVVGQMISVVKPGSTVYLTHFKNEGRREGYYGMHQWNFDIRRGEFVFSDGKGKRYTAAGEFGSIASISCETGKLYDKEIVVAKLRKLPHS